MTSVSIAMGTYNGARFIAEQLESLARQTVLPAEVIITDDASTDDTEAVVKVFAAKAPFPIRFEKNAERLGYRKNFLKAANLCASDIIAFCDQDDVWLPKKLEICLAAFAKNDVLLSYHAAMAVDEKLRPLGVTTLQAAPQTLNPPATIPPWRYGLGFTLVFRRQLLAYTDLQPHSADFFKPEHPEAHDQWFFFLASCLGTIAYTPEPLALYRQHANNTEGWQPASGTWKKIAKMIAADTLTLLRSRGIAARKRAAIMERIASTAHNSRAAQAASGYRQFAEGYERRCGLYTSVGFIGRLSLFIRLVKDGIYYAGPWTAGCKEGLRDLLRGVLFPEKHT